MNIITLGCSKNLYDSETLAGQLEKQGREVSHEGHGNIVVVNTCGFIGDAKEQSVNAILEQVERKRRGEIDRLYRIGLPVAALYGRTARGTSRNWTVFTE